MAFQAHPDRGLQEAFRRRPYQGANPAEAEFLFVGLDANFAPEIATHPIYVEVLEYLENGVEYWQRHGRHHPFLRDGYRGDGRLYHERFREIGPTAEHAPCVSFVELIHVPTLGRSRLRTGDLDAAHIARLRAAMTAGRARYVFMSRGAARLLAASGRFPELGPEATLLEEGLPGWRLDGGATVLQHYHFSVFGWQRKRLMEDIDRIAQIVRGSGGK